MIHDPHHTITTLTVLEPTGLAVTFGDGSTFHVDLGPTINAYPSLSALRDTALFSSARVDARGGYVVWIDDDLELAADNLRNIAIDADNSPSGCRAPLVRSGISLILRIAQRRLI